MKNYLHYFSDQENLKKIRLFNKILKIKNYEKKKVESNNKYIINEGKESLNSYLKNSLNDIKNKIEIETYYEKEKEKFCLIQEPFEKINIKPDKILTTNIISNSIRNSDYLTDNNDENRIIFINKDNSFIFDKFKTSSFHENCNTPNKTNYFYNFIENDKSINFKKNSKFPLTERTHNKEKKFINNNNDINPKVNCEKIEIKNNSFYEINQQDCDSNNRYYFFSEKNENYNINVRKDKNFNLSSNSDRLIFKRNNVENNKENNYSGLEGNNYKEKFQKINPIKKDNNKRDNCDFLEKRTIRHIDRFENYNNSIEFNDEKNNNNMKRIIFQNEEIQNKNFNSTWDFGFNNIDQNKIKNELEKIQRKEDKSSWIDSKNFEKGCFIF